MDRRSPSVRRGSRPGPQASHGCGGLSWLASISPQASATMAPGSPKPGVSRVKERCTGKRVLRYRSSRTRIASHNAGSTEAPTRPPSGGASSHTCPKSGRMPLTQASSLLPLGLFSRGATPPTVAGGRGLSRPGPFIKRLPCVHRAEMGRPYCYLSRIRWLDKAPLAATQRGFVAFRFRPGVCRVQSSGLHKEVTPRLSYKHDSCRFHLADSANTSAQAKPCSRIPVLGRVSFPPGCVSRQLGGWASFLSCSFRATTFRHELADTSRSSSAC